MEKIDIAIIGGGASGLMLANLLAETEYGTAPTVKTVVFERADRVGKKLSSTGNGQGNVTNAGVLTKEKGYFSCLGNTAVYEILKDFGAASFEEFWAKRGVALI